MFQLGYDWATACRCFNQRLSIIMKSALPSCHESFVHAHRRLLLRLACHGTRDIFALMRSAGAPIASDSGMQVESRKMRGFALRICRLIRRHSPAISCMSWYISLSVNHGRRSYPGLRNDLGAALSPILGILHPPVAPLPSLRPHLSSIWRTYGARRHTPYMQFASNHPQCRPTRR